MLFRQGGRKVSDKKAAANVDCAAAQSEQSLRQRAVAGLHDASSGLASTPLSPQAIEQTLHDLRVHQIELELQNEELRRTLAELDTTRSRYFDFYDLAPVGYCTVNDHDLIVQANLSTANLLGVRRKALIGQRFSRFVEPGDQDSFYRLRQRVLNSAEMQSLELRLLGVNGQTRWFYLQAIAAIDEAGAHQMRLVLSDLSELRQRDALIRLQAMALDQIQDRVTITDVHGIVTYLNQSGRANPEFPSDANLLGQHVSGYGNSAYSDAGHDEIIRTTLGQGGWTGKVGHLRPDGAVVMYELRTTLVKDESGEPVAMIGVGTDITQKFKLEQELRQREQSLRALLDNFPFQVWLKDLEGHYLAVNQALASAYGQPSTQSLVGKRFNDLVDPVYAARAWEQEQEIAASGTCTQVEVLLPLNGRPRWFETYKAPIVVDQQIVGTVGYSRDISERKQTELDLLAAKTEAVWANEAKSHFLAAASHDLRQPIFALSMFFESLKNRVAPDHGQLIAKIQGCVANLSELLTNLLDVSKLEAETVVPVACDFSVAKMLGKLLPAYEAQAKTAGLRLRSRHCDLIGHGDPVLLGRIVGNFLDNAIRHTRTGGVLIACRRHAGRQWIEVWDTGVGIPADKIELIFEPFMRLDAAARVQGSGLGLAIAKKTAALLGLQIRLRSQPGRGSMFAIELPLGQRLTPEQVDKLKPPARPLRVALVDDDQRVLDAMTLALEGLGHEVIPATGGKTLIDALGQSVPDILVSDYRLADAETGFDVIETSRKIYGQDLPALVITGDTAPALIRSMVARNITVLYKPLQLPELQSFIQNTAKSAR